jgi:CelD/BcsL family acetyltransferase involved in cellulose biosynthesis
VGWQQECLTTEIVALARFGLFLNETHSVATFDEAFALAKQAASSAQPFSDAAVFDAVESARSAWREITLQGVATPYQSYSFCDAWLETIGRAKGYRPLIVVVRNEAGCASALLPLFVAHRGGLRIAEFIGGKHANFHMGVFRAGPKPEAAALREILKRAGRQAKIDAFFLTNQPQEWRGVTNPLAELFDQPSPSNAHSTRFSEGFAPWLKARYSNSAQKKLAKKARRLETLGRVSFGRAQNAEEAAEILSAFLAHKRKRAASEAFVNDFDGEEIAQFIRRASVEGLAEGQPLVELYALRLDGRVIAVFGGLPRADRFSGMIISFDRDPAIARSSPGELLLHHVVRDLNARGFKAFDLGVGEARYKDACCETIEPLFDSAIGVTPLGKLASELFLARQRVKRWVKRTPWAWSVATRLFGRPG